MYADYTNKDAAKPNRFDTVANRAIVAAYLDNGANSVEVKALLTAECSTEKKIELLTKIGVNTPTVAELNAIRNKMIVVALVNVKWNAADTSKLYWAYFS
jgi:hypothetical protein